MSADEFAALRIELDLILKAMATVNPSLVTFEEWESFRSRVRELERRLRALETTLRGNEDID